MQELAKQFHIACAQGDIGRYCILPGDPGRVPAIAALFDDAKQIAYNREFNVWTGTLLGEKVTATKKLGFPLHTGIVQCKDSFYGQHDPAASPVYYELQQKWESWKRLGVKASEMESAALFVVAAALGCRCGSCFHVVWNQEREAAGLDQKMSEDTSSSVKVSVEALKLLIEADRKASR